MAGALDFFILGFPSIDGLIAQASQPTFLSDLLTSVWVWTRVALGIGFVIFVHELGHFLAAKWCGVKVEKFYVGFDVPIKIGPIQLPRTLGRFRWGETEYGIGTIPLGGYVKMLGQDDDPRKAEAEAKRIRQASSEADPSDDPETAALDPRSFPAKPVWQRMIIISAGVVMNLITGVLFAMFAFTLGVPFTPAVIGDVTPGGPAYQAGIEPGGKVVSVGSLPRDEKLHFREMRIAILTEGMNNPELPVPISIEYPDGVRHYNLQTEALTEDPAQRIIGILTPSSTKLNKSIVGSPGSVAATVLTKKDAEAQVIAVNGKSLPGDGSVDNVEASIALRKLLQENIAKPVTLTLQRTDGSKADVTIPPQRLKLPGIRFAVGPVKALIKDGVASKAGVQVGDVLVAVDGSRSIDAFDLPSQLADASMPVTMTFRRGTGEGAKDVEIELTPSNGQRSTSPISETSNTIAIDRFEFAFEALPTVARIEPTPQTADKIAGDKTAGDKIAGDKIAGDKIAGEEIAGNQPASGPANAIREGDVMRSFAVRWPGGQIPELLKEPGMEELRERLSDGWELSERYPLTTFVLATQMLPVGTEFDVMATRDGKIVESRTQLVATETLTADRGIVFGGVEQMHYASSVGEAFTLGIRESGRRLGDVFGFLKMLGQGKVQAKQIGGPIRIFSVAGSETSRGMSPLLMFLTMLSMNLAILNFLPIPALDGGHMMFLTAELVLGRPVDEKLQMQLTMAGVLALLSLMAFAVFNDIRQL